MISFTASNKIRLVVCFTLTVLLLGISGCGHKTQAVTPISLPGHSSINTVFGFDGTYLRCSEELETGQLDYLLHKDGTIIYQGENSTILLPEDDVSKIVLEDGSLCYCNVDQTIIAEGIYAGTNFSQGKAAVQYEECGEIFVIDPSGAVLFSLESMGSTLQGELSDGIAVSNRLNPADGTIQTFFISLEDQTVSETMYQGVTGFSEGLCMVNPPEGERSSVADPDAICGFIDTDFKLVIPYQFAVQSLGFHNGRIIVGQIHPETGVVLKGAIDTSGQLTVPYAYTELTQFNQRGYAVGKKEVDGKVVQELINAQGQQILAFPEQEAFSRYEIYDNFILLITADSAGSLQYRMIDFSGKELYPERNFQRIYPSDGDCVIAIEGEQALVVPIPNT